jgi:hypothetical protein
MSPLNPLDLKAGLTPDRVEIAEQQASFYGP